MKFEAQLFDLPKDKDGFFSDDNEDIYNDDLPILVIDEREGRCELVNHDNWGDWLSDFSKPCYKHYFRVCDIKLIKEQ